MADTKEKLSPITLILHWVVALTIISLLAVGIYMHENEVYELYPLHKSVGILIFLVILARVAWRIKNGWPTPVSTYKRHEQILSKTVHWVLIIGTVLMPITGMMFSGGGGHGFGVFGLELIASNYMQEPPYEAIPLNATIGQIGHATHGLLGNIMIVAILLHVLGALKHHVVDKDGTLRRMLGGRIGA